MTNEDFGTISRYRVHVCSMIRDAASCDRITRDDGRRGARREDRSPSACAAEIHCYVNVCMHSWKPRRMKRKRQVIAGQGANEKERRTITREACGAGGGGRGLQEERFCFTLAVESNVLEQRILMFQNFVK